MTTILSRVAEIIPGKLLLILLCALTLRFGLALVNQRPVASDELEHHRLAQSIVEDHAYSSAGKPTAFRPPGYPLFLSGLYFVAGPHPLVPRLFQAILDCITALLLSLLARPFGQRAAFLAAGIWAFYPPAILYSNLLLGETFFIFLLILSSVILLRWETNSPGRLFAVGIVLGLAILVKPGTTLFVVPLFFLFRKLRLAPLHQFAFAIGVLLLVTPWIVRNTYVIGKPILSSNTGINLFIGNNPNTTGGYSSTFPPEILAVAHDEDSLDRVSFDLATNYIMQQPLMTLVHAAKKLAYFAASEGELLVWSFHPDFTDSSTRFAVKYSTIPPILITLVNLSYAAVILLGLVSFFAMPRDTLAWFFLLFLVSLLALHVIFFGGSRFHLPLMPFFAVYAAPMVLSFNDTLRKLKRSHKVILALTIPALLALWSYELVYISSAS